MSRTLTLGLLTFFLVILGLSTFNGPLLVLAIPFITYLLIGLWRGPEAIKLEVERRISKERVIPGEAFTVTVKLTNHGAGIEELAISDPIPSFLEIIEGSPQHLISLDRGKTYTFTYTASGKRGHFQFDTLRVRASDRLGIVIWRETLTTHGQILVLPPVPPLKRIAIRPRVTRVYSGTIPARQGGPGTDFFGVRDYQPGDPTRSINWRATARHPRAIYSNEFEQERVADIGIILDARHRINDFRDNHSLFDHSVIAAAALINASLNAGNRVGLLIYGKYINWNVPGYGKQQRERLLQALARAQTGDSQAFASIVIPPQMFPPQSQLVFISPLQAEDLEPLLRMRVGGYPIIAISPDPITFETSFLPSTPQTRLAARILRLQRQILLQRLRHGGVQIVDWDVTRPFEQVAGPILSRPPAFLRAINTGGQA
jgi:uncharacterized protein (DUF58 family)